MTPEAIDAAAHRLLDAHRARGPYEPLGGELAPTDLDEAYAVQARFQALLAPARGRPAGWKIALSSKAMQAFCGIDRPIAGGFFADDVRRSPCVVEAATFQRLGIEFELAFTMAEPARDTGTSYDAQSIRPLIGACQPAFELIEDRNADYDRLDVLTLVADNAWCGGIVLGPEITDWAARDLDTLSAVLHYNDEPPAETTTGAADPLGSLAWVANHLISRGRSLAADETVITGSTLKTRFPTPGDHIRYTVGGTHTVDVVIT